MRRRRRHAFLLVLLALFLLPVFKPEGFPAFEGWFDGALHWTSRLGFSSPRASESGGASTDVDASRVRDMQINLLKERERYFGVLEEANQRVEFRDAVRDLENLPLARAARVLRAHDSSGLRRSILIDLGSNDGLVDGLAVVQGGVFVGVIQRCEAHSSRVQLITDSSSRLGVAVRTQEGTRVTAWLWGGGNEDAMALRNLRSADGVRVRADDPVLTSNKNELVPAGLIVGKVVSAADSDADLFLEVRIKPMFDLDRSTTVLVLLPPK